MKDTQKQAMSDVTSALPDLKFFKIDNRVLPKRRGQFHVPRKSKWNEVMQFAKLNYGSSKGTCRG